MFKKTLISLAVASSLGLTGCFDSAGSGSGNADPDYQITPDRNSQEFLSQFEGKVWPVFDPFPAVSDLPLPIDLIYSNVGDGSFTVPDSTPPVTTALNRLSGASTVAPIDLALSGRIDKDTVFGPEGGLLQNVFVFELDYASEDPLRGLSANEVPQGSAFSDFEVEVLDLSGTDFIRILPTKPLSPYKRYVVVVTDEIDDADGESIVSSPAYTELKDTDMVEPPGLGAVRNLINKFWEDVAQKALNTPIADLGTATFNEARQANSLPELTRNNIALSYSFTTSNDEKVLEYIANPANWIRDQVKLSVQATAAKTARGAHLLLLNEAGVEGAPSQTIGDWDLNDDGVVNGDDFEPFYSLYKSQMPGILQSFGFDEIEDAVAGAVENFTPSEAISTDLAPCDAAPAEDDARFACVGGALKGALGLPEPTSAGTDGIDVDFDSAQSAQAVSAVLSNIPGSANVNVAQGSIELPYYLDAPSASSGAAIRSTFWTADTSLASTLNTVFKDAGLVIPQGTGESDVLNSVFPFPEKKADIDVPMLVMYPKEIDTDSNGEPDTAFDPTTDAVKLPVVIYQHGITTDRSAALTQGSVLASQGVIVIAIDQPLHGVDPASTEERLELAGSLLKAINPDLNTEQLRAAVVEGDSDTLTAALGGDEEAAAGAASLIGTVSRGGSTIPGLSPTSTDQGIASSGATERHFGYGTNDQNSIIKMNFDPDAAAGESGDLFINLSNFIGSRDVLRQGSLDLMNLRASVGDIAPALDETNVYFVGHSLGTLNGAAFVAATNNSGRDELKIKAANLLTPVAGVVRMLENSPDLAPDIIGGLSAQTGLTQGDAGLQTFLNVFQHALDSVDPINFTESLDNVLLSEIVGDTVVINDGSTPLEGIFDAEIGGVETQVELNSSKAPLSGSTPFSEILVTNRLLVGSGETGLPAFVRFTSDADHTTPVLPDAEVPLAQDTFAQMALQTLKLISLDDAVEVVEDGSEGSIVSD